MLSISIASSLSDFEIAAEFAQEFGEWDAVQVAPYGISRKELIGAFHSYSATSLAAKFRDNDGQLLLARWNEKPAGTLAFNAFDDTAVEIHKFYVAPAFRGKGIGKAL